MGVDRSYVARNDASRQRLSARLDDLTANELLTQVDEDWTVGGLLAHLAFWDRLVLQRWGLAAREGKPTPIGLDDELTDLINDAAMPAWLAVNAARLPGLVLESAAEVDAAVAAVSDESVAAIEAEGRPRLLDRSRHRTLHLDRIEGVLGH
jgi:DinB family protein